MSEERKPLLSVTRKDLRIQFFRAGGKGGQNQNKRSSACRITHTESGAVGESRNHREQARNKIEAFRRLANSKKFRDWVRIQASGKAKELADVERKVDQELMDSRNVQVEVRNDDGAWEVKR